MALFLPKPRLAPWKRLSRRRVSTHRVFDVVETSWEKANGAAAGPFSTFECPDWCNVVAITSASELVLVWQHRFGTETLSLEIPGGVIDAGEAPEDAARRELREETGYDAGEIRPFLRVHPNPALQGNACHSFIARGARAAGAVQFDDDEECEVVLVPLAYAGELVFERHVTHSLSVCAILAFLATEP
jgi:ADP-ribose pyrophosphatase